MSTTLAKGMRLLEALCYAREPVGITALAQQIDMNLSAVQRLLGTLVQLGYAEQVKSRKYRATLLTWEVGAQVLRDNVLRRSIHPILRHAAHTTGYTAFFMLNNAPFATYFDKVEGKNGLTYSSELGTSVPITATASGLAITAFLTPDARQRLGTAAERGTIEFQPVDLAAMEAQIAEIRNRRYATSESGFRKGVNSVAAPVWGEDGKVCGSIALTADENELKIDDFVSVGQKVVRWADEATIVLGGEPYPQDFYV
jgi:DNA-binding IclR family transcriptional regulator